MNRTTYTATSLLGACVLATAMLAGGAAGARQLAATAPPTDPPSPATGHAEVVATWLVDFADGSYEWNVVEHIVDADGIDLAHSAPTFLIGDGDFSTVITGPEVRARLADGEALFRRPTLTTHAAALGGESAKLMEWAISTPPAGDDDGPDSDSIEPGTVAEANDHLLAPHLCLQNQLTLTEGGDAGGMCVTGPGTSRRGARRAPGRGSPWSQWPGCLTRRGQHGACRSPGP